MDLLNRAGTPAQVATDLLATELSGRIGIQAVRDGSALVLKRVTRIAPHVLDDLPLPYWSQGAGIETWAAHRTSHTLRTGPRCSMDRERFETWQRMGKATLSFSRLAASLERMTSEELATSTRRPSVSARCVSPGPTTRLWLAGRRSRSRGLRRRLGLERGDRGHARDPLSRRGPRACGPTAGG